METALLTALMAKNARLVKTGRMVQFIPVLAPQSESFRALVYFGAPAHVLRKKIDARLSSAGAVPWSAGADIACDSYFRFDLSAALDPAGGEEAWAGWANKVLLNLCWAARLTLDGCPEIVVVVWLGRGDEAMAAQLLDVLRISSPGMRFVFACQSSGGANTPRDAVLCEDILYHAIVAPRFGCGQLVCASGEAGAGAGAGAGNDGLKGLVEFCVRLDQALDGGEAK